MRREVRKLGLLVTACAALACSSSSGDTGPGTEAGDGTSSGGESAGESSGSGSSTAVDASTTDATGDGDTTTGDGDTTTGDGDTTTGDGDTTTGDGDTATGDGDTTTGDGDGDGTAAVWRFIAMGDGGEGNPDQYAVANAVEMVCADTGGCDFVLYLGDNFYDTGVDAIDDQQFQDKFELPYQDLDMPFWVVMGNHDYGLISNEWAKLDFEVQYTNVSTKWTMPDKWYTFSHQNAQFFGMDSTRLMWDFETSQQQQWLDAEVAASNAPWTFAFAHHPYISNGEHGNAGNFEGIPLLPLVSGVTVKQVIEESICGKVDFYLNGHDHNRQWLEPVCGTQFIVTGAAAKTTGFAHRDNNATAWETDQIEGFFWVEVQSDTQILTRFYDKDANLEYERAVTQ